MESTLVEVKATVPGTVTPAPTDISGATPDRLIVQADPVNVRLVTLVMDKGVPVLDNVTVELLSAIVRVFELFDDIPLAVME